MPYEMDCGCSLMMSLVHFPLEKSSWKDATHKDEMFADVT
jgi:hypothetical protein